MPITPGNATQIGYNTYAQQPPGWNLNVWIGAALIDANPARSWQIRDNRGNNLAIPDGSWIVDVGMTFSGDLIGTTGDRIKVAGSATSTDAWVVNTLPFSGAMLPAADYQLLLNPYTAQFVATGFTPALWLHTSNVASANAARAATTTPAVHIVPAEFPTEPVLVTVRYSYLTPSGGPSSSGPLYLSESQQRAVLGLPEYAA